MKLSASKQPVLSVQLLTSVGRKIAAQKGQRAWRQKHKLSTGPTSRSGWVQTRHFSELLLKIVKKKPWKSDIFFRNLKHAWFGPSMLTPSQFSGLPPTPKASTTTLLLWLLWDPFTHSCYQRNITLIHKPCKSHWNPEYLINPQSISVFLFLFRHYCLLHLTVEIVAVYIYVFINSREHIYLFCKKHWLFGPSAHTGLPDTHLLGGH